jgi:VCBS repeat-containing protein
MGPIGPIAGALGIAAAALLGNAGVAAADRGDGHSTAADDSPAHARPGRADRHGTATRAIGSPRTGMAVARAAAAGAGDERPGPGAVRQPGNPVAEVPIDVSTSTPVPPVFAAAAVPPVAAAVYLPVAAPPPVAAAPPRTAVTNAVAPRLTALTAPAAAPDQASPAEPARRPTPGVIAALAASAAAGGGGQPAPIGPLPADVLAVTFVRRQVGVAASVTPKAAQQLSAQAVGSDPLAGFLALFSNATPAVTPVQGAQGAGGVVSGRLNASDPDSSTLRYTVAQAPVHGTASVLADGTYTYTPDPALAATGTTDSFRVTVTDADSGFHIHGIGGLLNLLTFGLLGSSGHTSTATVAVTVAPFGGANHAPTGTVTVDTPNAVTGVVTGRVVGADADGDPLTYSSVAATTKGAVAVTATSGAFTYTPTDTARQNAAAPGATTADKTDSFSVTVADGRGGTANVAVTVPVVPAGAPVTPLAAFPGAEGFGASATGGRGGSVVYVTNLNASGPGSLQWAIDQPGSKYILFKVSGVIDSQIHLTNGNVTIAGQSSPGGITVRGFVTDETPYQDQAVQAPADFAENWILQHIRIRPGLDGPSDDGLRLRYTRNAIVDHVSIGNATDEAIEISYSRDITVQNTLIAETVGGHSFYGGVLINYSNPAHGFGLDNVSLHHNVFNRIEGRLPEGSRESLAAAGSYMNLEMSNNLYWDPNFFIALGLNTNSLTDSSGNPYPIYWNLNAVNNYFRTRSDFPYGMFDDQIMRTPRNNLYVSGNKMNLYPTRSDYQLFYCCNDYPSVTDPNTSGQAAHKLPSRNPFPTITYTPTGQLVNVLLNTAGAWPRDPMDVRLMRSVATNTIATPPRNTNPAGDALFTAYTGTAPAPPADTDSDGMPDAWESAHGLNPNAGNTNGHTLSGSGYTDLEVYLNELSASRVTGWAG